MRQIRISVFVVMISMTFAIQSWGQTQISSDQISVAGTIESSSGGFKFPDGTTQLTSADALLARIELLESKLAELQTELLANTQADSIAHHPRYSDSEAQNAVGPHFSGDHADLNNVTPGQHHEKYSDAEAIAAVGDHSPDYSDLLAGVSRIIDPNTGQDTFRFTGMNVQVVNGNGGTETKNSVGNLIIGYNETRGEESAEELCPSEPGIEFHCNRRSGSHNLVIGQLHNYSNFGGVLAGAANESAGDFASVLGGVRNIATGDFSSIVSGTNNTAGGHASVVVAGEGNQTIDNAYSVVISGSWNIASGYASAVVSGMDNTASGERSWVGGGDSNIASDTFGGMSSVVGGNTNTASGYWAVVTGGSNNTASGHMSTVNGGGQNTASVHMSSVSGGILNVADGEYSSVLGGYTNTASGIFSTIVGGQNNQTTTNGDRSAILGGAGRTADSIVCVVGDDGVDC